MLVQQALLLYILLALKVVFFDSISRSCYASSRSKQIVWCSCSTTTASAFSWPRSQSSVAHHRISTQRDLCKLQLAPTLGTFVILIIAFYAVGIYRLTLWHWLIVIVLYTLIDNYFSFNGINQNPISFSTIHGRFCWHCRYWTALYRSLVDEIK